MQHLLVTGPPGCGKTTDILQRYREAPDRAWILTPTATMAEHLANELARAGVPVRPSRVLTLSRFAEPWAAPLQAPSEARLHALVDAVLRETAPAVFRSVSGFAGFHAAVAGLLEELGSGGVPSQRLGRLAGPQHRALSQVFAAVESRLRGGGFALRFERLQRAAARLKESASPELYLVDGFFEFAPPERELLLALAARGTVVATLPEKAQADAAWFGANGFSEKRLATCHRSPRRAMFRSPTLGMEANEIARRIVGEIERGRPPREIGVVVRSRDPYVPALETAFTRFGIPFHSYFADPLERHPAVRFLAGLCEAALQGWNWEALLPVLRMPAGPLARAEDADAFEFELRERRPGSGLDPLRVRDPQFVSEVESVFDTRTATPAVWSQRLARLVDLLPAPADREEWRATHAAVEAFLESLQESVLLMPDQPATFEAYWQQASRAISLAVLRSRAVSREVVHIVDVFEARQWELPLIFVCGLNERLFPRYHSQDPLLDDESRRRLGLPVSSDREADESFLFELALTRATEQVTLSYSRFNEKGDDQLPSFLLPAGEVEDCSTRVRPAPELPKQSDPRVSIDDSDLRLLLAQRHGKLSPSGVESYLQCPFQFFVGRTLRLNPRPVAPEERLDALVQGNIIHSALESASQPLFLEAEFEKAFEEACREKNIPATYRREAIRREMLRNVSAVGAIHMPGWNAETEAKFDVKLNDEVAISGRIDRLEWNRKNEALVIDFKYSAAANVKNRMQADTAVQAGLYLHAAKAQFQKKPVGMLFCSVKNGVEWQGWRLEHPDLEDKGVVVTPDTLKDLVDDAIRKTLDSHAQILQGRILPQPADRNRCKWCDAADICRFDFGEADTQDDAAAAGAEEA